MTEASKLKPMSAHLAVLFGGEEKSLWTASLVPFHVQDECVMAAGALLGSDGRSCGTIQIAGMPVTEWPKAAPVGRPRKDEEHLALLLAWCLLLHRNGGKRGNTDDQLALAWGLADGKKVARIRREQADKYGVDLSEEGEGHLMVTDPSAGSPIEAAVIIPNPTWYQRGSGIEVLGVGAAWSDAFQKRVAAGAMQVSVEQVDPTFDLAKVTALGGPIIITVIRSPR